MSAIGLLILNIVWMNDAALARRVVSVHPETVFSESRRLAYLPDGGVARLSKNAHVPKYAPLFRRPRALPPDKNPRFRMGTS